MSILEGALLGLLQGLAEFLPISSSGHLNLLQALFGVEVEHQLLFNILLHVATLAAVGIMFWKDWVDMILHPIKNRTLLLLFIASLPALAAKILFDDLLDYAESHISCNAELTARQVSEVCALDDGCRVLLERACEKYQLSMRAVSRIQKALVPRMVMVLPTFT